MNGEKAGWAGLGVVCVRAPQGVQLGSACGSKSRTRSVTPTAFSSARARSPFLSSDRPGSALAARQQVVHDFRHKVLSHDVCVCLCARACMRARACGRAGGRVHIGGSGQEGYTAFILAASNGHREVVRFLLDKGAAADAAAKVADNTCDGRVSKQTHTKTRAQARALLPSARGLL